MNQVLSDALRDFTGLLKQLITNLLGNEADLWGNELKKFLRKEPCWTPVQKGQTVETKKAEAKLTEFQLAKWAELYKELDITLDPKEVVIPESKPGFDRLIVVPKGMTAQKAFDLCLKRFNRKCWKYTDKSLDEAVPTNDRTAENAAYAIWIRDREEADEELKSLSANDLAEKSIKGITPCERLLFEIKYHAETSKHLDRKNWTLCNGSRASDGYVPYVLWCDGKLDVDWSHPSDRDSRLRAREVVTL